MFQLIKKSVVPLIILSGIQNSSAFSLLGPFDTWQAVEIGYQLPGDKGGPMALGEEYRINTPNITYSFDESFINFFGVRGIQEVEKAMAMLNSVPPVSKMSADLSEFPSSAPRPNGRALALQLSDLKTTAASAVLEQIGLAAPERYVWTLRNRTVVDEVPYYSVLQRNFDPVTQAPSRYVNGVGYTFQILQTYIDPVVYEAVPLVLDPTDPLFTTLVSFVGMNGGSASRNYNTFDSLAAPAGLHYSSLTRDDAGALRYLLSSANLNNENPIPDVLDPVLPTTNIVVVTTNNAVATTNYFISNTGVQEGNVYVSWTQAGSGDLTNDSIANPTLLSGHSGSVMGTTFGATKEVGEPGHARTDGGASVWFEWTAPENGVFLIDTVGSSFDTALEVYTGTNYQDLKQVETAFQQYAENDDLSTDIRLQNGLMQYKQSLLSFNAVGGVTYKIVIDGVLNNRIGEVESGIYHLNWELTESLVPLNNNFANAELISGLVGSAVGMNFNADTETMEADHADNTGGASIWYRWSAPVTGTATINTLGSQFDTLLAVYTGSQLNTLIVQAENDDYQPSSRQSEVVLDVTQGTTYYIAVDGFKNFQSAARTGVVLLNWEVTATNPTLLYDNLASGRPVSSTIGSFVQSNVGATRETSEPLHNGNLGGKSIWIRWAAPISGQVKFSTSGSDFDTVIAVYQGSTLENLSEITSNDDFSNVQQSSEVIFAATAGQMYYIAIDGYQNELNGQQLLAQLGLTANALRQSSLNITVTDPFGLPNGATTVANPNDPFNPVGVGGGVIGVGGVLVTNTVITEIVNTNLFVTTGLRGGIDKISFSRVDFDSLLGQTFTPVTNVYVDSVIVSQNGSKTGKALKQTSQRVSVAPDIIFSAEDLGVDADGYPFYLIITSGANFINHQDINGVTLGAGPGVIDPIANISFSKIGPFFYQEGGGTEDNGFSGFFWGAFDGSTNAPVVLPGGISLEEVEDLVLQR